MPTAIAREATNNIDIHCLYHLYPLKIGKPWETDQHLRTLLTLEVYMQLELNCHNLAHNVNIRNISREKNDSSVCHSVSSSIARDFIIFPGHETEESGVMSVILHLKTNHHDDVASHAPSSNPFESFLSTACQSAAQLKVACASLPNDGRDPYLRKDKEGTGHCHLRVFLKQTPHKFSKHKVRDNLQD